MSQYVRDLKSWSAAEMLRAFRIEEQPSTAPSVMNQSPFHIVNGVTFARDFHIDRMIAFLAAARSHAFSESECPAFH